MRGHQGVERRGSPRADFNITETRSRDARARNTDRWSRAPLHLTLRSAVEEQVRGCPVSEEGLHIARWVERSVLVARQGEGRIDYSIPIVCATYTVAIVAGATAGDVPVDYRAIGHEGVHVGIDGAGNDPLISRQTLGDDVCIESEEDRI